MNNAYSAKRAAVAILMVLVLVFSVPMNFAAVQAPSDKNVPMAQNSSPVVNLNTNANTNKNADSASATPSVLTETQAEYGIDEKYDIQESIPEEKVTVVADEILPDEDSGYNEIENDYAEQEGVTVVPATLNNIMLDGLPSIISKKVYTFSIESRGAIKYAFTHEIDEEKICLWYITLYEEYLPDGSGKTVDYRALNRISYESVGVGVQSTVIGVLPGNYRVEVECISGYTEQKYQLAIGFAETAFCEAEPNNSVTRYNELLLNRTFNGTASVFPNGESDEDWYLFRVPESGYTVLYFEHEIDEAGSKENIAWRVRLTDANGEEYFYTTAKMEKTMINSGVMGLAPGVYFITVSSHIHSSIEYSLNVSFTPDPAVETELNETPETADPIGINTEKVGSLTDRYGVADRDYFSFTMESDGFVTIDFIHEVMTEANDGWNVSILSADGRLIFSAVSDWNQNLLRSPYIGLTAGDYYIRVDSDNLYHNSMIYRLVLSSELNPDWETEPNNLPADADILKIGKSVNGTLVETGVDYDKDWYRIDVAEKQTLSFSFVHVATEEAGKEGWIVSLVDEKGNIIGTTTSDWDEAEKSISLILPEGSYYIVIETGLYFNSGRYILSVR